MDYDNYNLEKLVFKYDKIRDCIRDYSIDTSARIVCYIPPLAAWEKFVAGMDNKEVLNSRGLAILVNMLIARPYGKFREYWTKICKTDENSSFIRKFVTDTSGSVAFGLPTYFGVLYYSGASLEEILTALPFGVVLTATTGRIYGRFLDWYSKKLGGKPVLNK